MLKQRDIITINFEPSKGHEIYKRRPALVISRTKYNLSTPFVIVCPITSTQSKRPYLVPLPSQANHNLKRPSQLDTSQIYSLDVTKEGHRNPKLIGNLDLPTFLYVIQYVQNDFGLN